MTAPRIPTDRPMAEPGKPSADREPAAPTRPAEPGATDAGAKRDARDDDEEDEWRHEPIAPVDETNPLRSLGKAVGDTVTGSDPDARVPPKR